MLTVVFLLLTVRNGKTTLPLGVLFQNSELPWIWNMLKNPPTHTRQCCMCLLTPSPVQVPGQLWEDCGQVVCRVYQVWPLLRLVQAAGKEHLHLATSHLLHIPTRGSSYRCQNLIPLSWPVFRDLRGRNPNISKNTKWVHFYTCHLGKKEVNQLERCMSARTIHFRGSLIASPLRKYCSMAVFPNPVFRDPQIVYVFAPS